MKRLVAAMTVLLAAGMLLSGCRGVADISANKNSGTPAVKDKMKIYASFYPMYFLASEIAGDKAEVISMVPAGAEPHDWEPTPRLAVELNDADILVYNGAGMEVWIDKILSIMNSKKTAVVDASKGIGLLKAEGHGEEEHEEEKHEHGLYDPHVWVSPLRLKQQAQNVYEAIAEKDPENSEYYRENYSGLVSKLTRLDKDIRDASRHFKSNVIVVSHEAFGYFAEDYGFKQIAIRGANPQEEPSPAKLGELAAKCRENAVKYVFFEKLTSPKLSDTLAREVGAGTLVLNDAAGLSKEDIRSGKDYITVMYENIENLKKALGD